VGNVREKSPRGFWSFILGGGSQEEVLFFYGERYGRVSGELRCVSGYLCGIYAE